MPVVQSSGQPQVQRRHVSVIVRAEPSKEELRAYGLTMEDIRRYGNRTPAEVANMKKWGRILSQRDTCDGDFLEKADPAMPGTKASAMGMMDGNVLVVGVSTVVLLTLTLFVSAPS